jgi:hypothetical protein
MAWTQDEADDFLKTFSAVEKRNNPTEADIKEQNRLKRQEELLAAAKAQEVEAGKSIWDRAGDVAGGVGNFVKDAVVSIKDDAVNTYTGIKDTIEGSVAASENLKDTEKYLADQKVLMNELDKATGGKTGDEDPAAWEKPEVKEIQRKLNKLALENGSGGYLTDEQKAAAGADQTKIDTKKKVSENRTKEFDEAQAVDAKKTAFAAGSTFLNVATIGAGTAVKAGGKQAIVQAVKAGGKNAVAK